MNWELAKWIGITALFALWSLFCFEQGGERGKVKLEALQAAQAEAVSKAVLAEKSAQMAEQGRLNGIIATYEQKLQTPDPIVSTIATRLLYRACSGPVSETGGTPAGTLSPSALPPSNSRLEPAVRRVIEACSQDAIELTALQQAWPR